MTDALHDKLAEALRLSANGLRHCSRWNISDEKRQALLTHVGTIETRLRAYDEQKAKDSGRVA
jgi:hypothetical protein